MKKPTVEEFLRIAAKEIGYVEQPVNKTKYGKEFGADGTQWCGWFVMWCGKQATGNTRWMPWTAYTPTGVANWKRKMRWRSKGTPQSGDIAYFDFPNDNLHRVSHVGIVVRALNEDQILCIEGNTSTKAGGDQRNGGEVAIKLRLRSHIVGWGKPKYKKDFTPIIAKIVADFEAKLEGKK